MMVDLGAFLEPAVIVAIVTAVGGIITLRYRSHGKTLRQQMKELSDDNKALRQEVDNLKIQLAPNQTPCIWVNRNAEVVSFNGSAILKVFSRLGISSTGSYGKKLSDIIGSENTEIIKRAINSPTQSSTAESFIVGGKLTVKFAVAYVIYDNDKKDAVIELQLIV